MNEDRISRLRYARGLLGRNMIMNYKIWDEIPQVLIHSFNLLADMLNDVEPDAAFSRLHFRWWWDGQDGFRKEWERNKDWGVWHP